MKVIRKIKEHGFRRVFNHFVQVILRISIKKAHYLRLTIDIEKTNELLQNFDLDVKELVLDDFLRGDPTVFNGSKLDLYKSRLADPTYKAFGIIENDRLVYSTWISLHRLGMSVETKPIYLASNEGYLEDSYCDPIARGKGLHGKMNNYRIKKIYETGRNRVIAIVQDGNIPAMKVQLKSGFEELGTFYQGYLFGFRINTLKKEKFDCK